MWELGCRGPLKMGKLETLGEVWSFESQGEAFHKLFPPEQATYKHKAGVSEGCFTEHLACPEFPEGQVTCDM